MNCNVEVIICVPLCAFIKSCNWQSGKTLQNLICITHFVVFFKFLSLLRIPLVHKTSMTVLLLKYSIIQCGHNWTVCKLFKVLYIILYLVFTKHKVGCLHMCVCVSERERDYVTAITEENYF